MYWNILVWLRIEIPDGFLHQISENLKIDDLVTGGTINLQLTQQDSNKFCKMCKREQDTDLQVCTHNLYTYLHRNEIKMFCFYKLMYFILVP